ncbi:Extracellular matrix-binding ebh [Babesia ovata]|uniref:Extracellular matrix-binding ebh n=1 Tax=Babesia ovata TaxID=189622 RepID=A0A2H6K8F9_9APIC|nr:Extracellular matrix-binding ebh [Babesia ovata]GBE59287.1 Extracellular matrix-binding ebh [Babesia ovata]
MAPKKLTDCPENLRESIDWLIQVRHGNGPNGDGLKSLAEALQKLITETITKATTSLENRKKELECPPIYWQPDSYCKDKQKEIEDKQAKIKEAEQSQDASQNGLLSSENSYLDKLKSDLENHYNDVHYLTDDARQEALDDIDARRISLGTLAGQLSGLIGGSGEVKNAILKGLHSNVNQLEKLLKTSCGGEGCNCDIKSFSVGPLKKLQKTFNDIDKIERQFDSLKNEIAGKSKASVGTPSVIDPEIERQIEAEKKKLDEQNKLLERQITQLQKQLEEPKNKIESAINSLNEKIKSINNDIEDHKKAEKKKLESQGYNDIKDADISIPSHLSNPLETEQAKLKSHKASLDSLENLDKLIKFHQNAQNKKGEECKNILTNLCTGLETFLGFNPASKGYDGTGIVYSDLDRLCDGVMAFWGGVLKDVHTNNNLSPYKTTLDAAVKALETHRHEGKTGLRTVIDRVKQGIGQWLEAVTLSNIHVTKYIRELETNFIPKLIETIENMKKKSYDEVATKGENELLTWISNVERLPEKSEASLKKLLYVDHKLQSQLNQHLSVIHQAVTDFVESADCDHNGLLAVTRDVKEQIQDLKLKVNKVAEEEQSKCIDELQEEFNENIQQPIENVKEKLECVHQQLEKWIRDAGKYLGTEIGRVKNEVYNKLDHHKPRDGPRRTDIGQGIEQIEKANVKVKYVNSELKKQIDNLEAWKQKAQGAASAALSKCGEILGKVREEDPIKPKTDIGKAAKKLQDDAFHLYQQMKQAYDFIHPKVGEALGAIDTEVKTAVKKDLAALRDAIKVTVEAYFTELEEVNFGKAAAVKYTNTSFLNLKGESFKKWLQEVGNQGLQPELKNQYDHVINTQVEALKSVLYVLEACKKKLTGTSAFAAMGGDAVAKIEEAHGKDHSVTINTGDSTQNYDSATGKEKVTAPLRSIQGGEGLQKLNNIQDSENQTIIDNQTFTLQFKNVTSQLKDLSELVTNPLQPEQKPDGVKDYLADLREMIKRDAEYKLQSYLKGSVHGLAKIHADLNGKLSTLSGQPNAIDSGIHKITSVLDSIRTVLKKELNGADGVIDKLTELQSMGVFNVEDWNGTMSLKKISNMINNIIYGTGEGEDKTNLEAIIEAFQKFNTSINEKVKQCISAITSELKNQVDLKIKTLQNSALSQFAQSKAHALQKLKELVEKKNETIKRIIETDSNTGMKGMMKLMNGENVPGVTSSQDKFTPFVKFVQRDLNQSPMKGDEHRQKCSELSEKFKDYLLQILPYIITQVDLTPDEKKAATVAQTPQTSDHTKEVGKIQQQLNTLLDYFNNTSTTQNTRKYIYDNKFKKKRNDLISSLASLSPQQFATPRHPELLDAVRAGLTKFADELGMAYVSRYDGGEPVENWEDNSSSDKLTTEGRNCAKVCLTILEGLRKDLFDLQNECKNGSLQINTHQNKSLGSFFHKRGYTVNSENGKQTGELQDKKEMEGSKIKTTLLEMKIENADNVESLKQWKAEKKQGGDISLLNLVDFLRDFSRRCYRVGHYYIPASPKSPSNIYNMLCWLAGLKYNHMYDGVKGQFTKMLDGLKEEYKLDTAEFPVAVPDERKHPTDGTLTYGNLSLSLDQVCLYSRTVLITFLGHGHADGVYACDFSTNAYNLLYPSSPASCLDILADVLCRVYEQLYFLSIQCKNGPTLGGWADCWYGQGVGGSAWLCNDRQCPNQQGDQAATQNSNQKHNQTCNQKCDQRVMCGLKSPLQSFLEDGLQGFLPHQFKSPGCKLECTLSNHRGLPCKTPMGFSDIGTVASHTKRASHLKDALSYFCGSGSNLNKLCSYFKCLLRVAPQTLGDMFAFYYQLLHKWDDNSIKQHKKEAFDNAVKRAIFGQTYSKLNPTILFDPAVHAKHGKSNHTLADFFSLTDCNPKSGSGLPCGRYLHPLTLDIYDIHSKYNGSRYLSWVVYSTETFYDLLKKLYDECCNKCGASGTKCHDKSCSKECKVNYNDQNGNAKNPSTNDKHTSGCHTIVKCPDMHPTLYQHGFTFGSPSGLSEEKDIRKRRTCGDFCQALKRVIGEKCVVVRLLQQIDDYIWAIREKFSYLLLTLWSLSLLYLLHIAVVRLDVPRIRSHLRSPASHRIAAQSLLAAARVKHGGGIPRLSDALGKLFDNVVQGAETSSSSLPESDEPAARDVITKLQGFRSSLPKNPENSNENILHNLCSAVESFLGYRSPGTYDGSGIVYGDASRLCDAVVAFLYRVLSDVRDNQPYAVGRALLGGLVGDLEKARWSGHQGFKTVVPKVASGLGDYNEAVKASNDRVKAPINELLKYVKEGGELLRRVNDLQVGDVTEEEVKKAERLVEECHENVKQFRNKMGKAPNNINDLNNGLRIKIDNARKNIGHENLRLKQWSKKQLENYKAMIKLIKQAFQKLRASVHSHIEREVIYLVQQLRNLVRSMLRELKKINALLEDYVADLETWIKESQEFIDKVLEKSDEIVKEFDDIDTEKYPHKKNLDESIRKVERELEQKVADLGTWKNAAKKVLDSAILHTNNVRGSLDHKMQDDGKFTTIGTGVNKINEARDAVRQVDTELQSIHGDIDKWRDAAQSALGTAVSKAQTVHGRLDPVSSDPIGKKIIAITETNKGIQSANESLKNEVNRLEKWIESAAEIRDKAQIKAEEAYKKLEYKEKLAENIRNIENANKEIKEVHSKLSDVDSQLTEWHTQAGSVLGEAIKQAQEVYTKLDPVKNDDAANNPVGHQIHLISTNNSAISNANTQLKNHLSSLQQWYTAAEAVIKKASEKCDEILKRVDKDDTDYHTNGIIKQQAELLQNKATELLTAYSKAYGEVNGLVGKVQGAISQLEEGMKEDLQTIRDRIVRQMKTHVGGMLGEIKTQVQVIKGKDGSDWSGGTPSGLLGIVTGVHNYATAFRNNNFAEIAKGWLEATVLKHNGTVRRILGWKENEDMTGNIGAFGIGMKTRLSDDVNSVAKEAFKNVDVVSGGVTESIQAVQRLCEEIATALDKELYTAGRKTVDYVKNDALTKGSLVSGIKNCVCDCGQCDKKECGKKAAAELIMCALTSTVRQVGNELYSVFLYGDRIHKDSGKCIASELDKAVQATKTLHDQLGVAEDATRNQPTGTSVSYPGNEILEKVTQIATVVKKEMKNENGDINVATTMPTYEQKKNGKGAGKNLYHNLITKDVKETMNPFMDHAKLSNPSEVPTERQEVEAHVTKITEELQAIAGMVDSSKKPPSGGDTKDGVKQRLDNLGSMLKKEDIQLKGKGIIPETVKGLEKIHETIQNLKTQQYEQKSNEIGEAVTQIKAQLEEIRKQLKKEPSSGPGNGVIDELSEMLSKGLGNEKSNWQTKSADKFDGLGSITKELQEQNEKLNGQNDIIAKAIRKIQLELKYLGIRLDKSFHDDDVLYFLEQLQKQIGRGYRGGENLQKIKNEVKKLQSVEFTDKPIAIDGANEAIKEELVKLRGVLKDDNGGEDVITTLKDLMTTGLGKDANWKNFNGQSIKGLENIQDTLHGQHNELTKQPEKIGGGTDQITQELTRLQQQLDDATKKLDALQKHGLENGDDAWTSDDKKSTGITKITTEIKTIKTKDVADVSANVRALCAAIRRDCRELKDFLKHLKENLIGEQLKNIKDQIESLRTKQLAGVIRDAREFERFAEQTCRETIEQLKAYVDQELKKAEDKLLAEARRQYVSTVKEMLKSFAAKVETELEELPKEVDDDLKKGFKGLMRQMEDGTTDDISTAKGENINKLKNVRDPKDVAAVSSAFMKFFGPLKDYLRDEITRVHDEESNKKHPSLPPSAEPYAEKLYEVNATLNTVLIEIQNAHGYDHRLPEMLNYLIKTLGEMKPEAFGKITTPLLDTVGRGLRDFSAEFGDAYVSTYSGAEYREADADKYAKVLLSFIPMTHEALSNLADKCGGNWRGNKISKLTSDDRDNGLGNYLTKCGFKVSPTDGLQEGELQNHGDMIGEQIHALLKSTVADVAVKMLIEGKPSETGINVVDLVALFHNMLCRYLQVCHLKVHESPRCPCTVRDMLSWLTGLQYTLVADKLTDHCRALLNRKCDDNDAPNRDDAVMAQCINGLPFTIASACSYANSLLIAIQGHGRGFDLAAYPYSVDFANNRAQLYYPADPADLLDMLRQIVCRLYPALYFLYAQCCRDAAKTKGWRECRYGRQVPSSHWQCNTLGMQATDASHNCPPTSPLQSFLSDSCPSLLPHKLTAADNVIECTNCPANLPGQQCLIPLGFWDLALAASMKRTGKDLAKSLGRLCSDADACLFQLCRTLSLLCPAAPQSLGDVFALFSQMLRMWNHESSRRAYSHHESYLTHLNGEAIDKLFPLWTQLHGSYRNADLTDALQALAGHEHENSGHDALSSLSAEPPCQPPSGCAPFLQPLSLHANHTFPQKHAQLYVSWIVWLAWRLWDLLQSLLEVLNNVDCTAHGCVTCLCPPGKHGNKDACQCGSLVECGGSLPALYRYGFTCRNAHALVAGSQKMCCSDLNAQLNKTLHSDHFTQLFLQIDELLWHLRMPFLFTIVTLWLTATLYIAHTTLYRLDVLRIRSHLMRTKASHLIEVKVLLTKGRRMLSLYSDVDYFDDAPVD